MLPNIRSGPDKDERRTSKLAYGKIRKRTNLSLQRKMLDEIPIKTTPFQTPTRFILLDHSLLFGPNATFD
jgi:hypothetical protein